MQPCWAQETYLKKQNKKTLKKTMNGNVSNTFIQLGAAGPVIMKTEWQDENVLDNVVI